MKLATPGPNVPVTGDYYDGPRPSLGIRLMSCVGLRSHRKNKSRDHGQIGVSPPNQKENENSGEKDTYASDMIFKEK